MVTGLCKMGPDPHRTQDVFQMLLENFGTRVIGLGFPDHAGDGIEWPPYSPHLNPCDFFLWGFLKDRVYRGGPETLEQLKIAIENEINNISQVVINKVIHNFVARLHHIVVGGGSHFENIVN